MDTTERTRERNGRFAHERSEPGLTLDAKLAGDVEATRDTARRLLDEHGLDDWRITVTNTRRRLGVTSFALKTVSISRQHIVSGSSEEILDTIRHEVAHALVGPGHNHDAVWQAKATELGARSRAIAAPSETRKQSIQGRRDALAAAKRYPKHYMRIEPGTRAVVMSGQEYLLGREVTVVEPRQSRYEIHTDDGHVFYARPELLGRIGVNA